MLPLQPDPAMTQAITVEEIFTSVKTSSTITKSNYNLPDICDRKNECYVGELNVNTGMATSIRNRITVKGSKLRSVRLLTGYL